MVKTPLSYSLWSIILSQSQTDQTIAIFAVVFSLFLIPNYAATLGTFYVVGALAYLVSHVSSLLPQISIQRPGGNTIITAGLIAVVAGLFWIIGSSFIIFGTGGNFAEATQSIIRLYSNVQTTSPLVTTEGMNLLVYGLNIPLVETLVFFGVILPLFALNVFKIPIAWRPNDLKMWWTIAIVAVLFALFHITAHGLSNSALLVDAFFGFVSGIIVFRSGFLISALLLHIFVNSGIILSSGVI